MPKFSGTTRRPLRINLRGPVRTTAERARTFEGGDARIRDAESELFLLAATTWSARTPSTSAPRRETLASPSSSTR